MPGIVSNFNQVSHSAPFVLQACNALPWVEESALTRRQLFFRGAVLTSFGSTKWKNLDGYIDPGLSTHQTIESVESVNQIVFHSDLRWYAAAAVIEVFS